MTKVGLLLGFIWFATLGLASKVHSEPTGTQGDVPPKLKTSIVRDGVRFTPGEIVRQRNLVLLPLELEVRTPIYECGCKTPYIFYKVMEPVKPRMYELSRGAIDSRPRIGRVDQVFLVLSHDGSVPARQPLEIYFSCNGD